MIRRFRLTDAPDCYAVFHAAVHLGTQAFYSAAERTAWAPNAEMPDEWPDRLADQITYVSETGKAIEGFFTLNHDGHLDLAYVRPEKMGTGLAARLLSACLADPAAAGLTRAYTEASHLAKPFFKRQGWQVLKEQRVERFDQQLTNFRMAIEL